jgi:hypothetical protein
LTPDMAVPTNTFDGKPEMASYLPVTALSSGEEAACEAATDVGGMARAFSQCVYRGGVSAVSPSQLWQQRSCNPTLRIHTSIALHGRWWTGRVCFRVQSSTPWAVRFSGPDKRGLGSAYKNDTCCKGGGSRCLVCKCAVLTFNRPRSIDSTT